MTNNYVKILIKQTLKMKLNKITILSLLLIIVMGSLAFSKPRVVVNGNPIKFANNAPPVVIQRVIMNANNVEAYFQNTGIFDQNTTSGNTAGLIWPKGSGKTASFTAGLSIGCQIGGMMAQVMASYKGEYTPGYVVSGLTPTPKTGPEFKLYNVRLGDNASTNPDYANWGSMVVYGAPYVDVNKNGQFEPGIDIPGQENASQTLFQTMTDAFIDQKSSGEGFGGGVNSPLLNAEVHWTSWAYTSPGLEDMQFINWVIINKGNVAWDSTFMGLVVDPDLGNDKDDYIGCDTNLNMGYCYNGTDNDNMYGTAPPCFGMDFFKSPIIRKPGFPNDTLGLTSFVFFTNTGSSPPPCESDPNGEPGPAYKMLQGYKKYGEQFMDPTKPDPARPGYFMPTKFVYYGDPETGIGWTEFKGSVQNCGGDSGTVIGLNPPGDRRFIFNTGRYDFSFLPGDTQNIVVAQFVARGNNFKNSVTKAKSLAKTAKIIYDNNFNVTPPPPTPLVNYTVTPTVNGLCNITLSWDDRAESYYYWDTIFFPPDSLNKYYFQGYEIYEINKFANTLPDFTKPESMNEDLKLIDIFDLRDNIGMIMDTFSTGVTINGQEQFAPFPIVPPYKMVKPANFPNHGISRSITLTETKYANNYNGQTSFIYGQEYQFAVVVYAVSSSNKIRRGFKVIRNSVQSSIVKVRPTTPPAGTYYTYKNGDTLKLKEPIKDLGCIPVIVNQDKLLTTSYRVVFGKPNGQLNTDTSYMILRKNITSGVWDTLKTGLKAGYKSGTDDSSRVIDGVFINVQKIRYQPSGISYAGNFGVIPDPTLKPDSIQARNTGWTYSNMQNQWIQGATKCLINNNKVKFQNVSMGLTYPANGFYNSVGSLLRPWGARKVEIRFTGDTNTGQIAYRFAKNTQFPLYDSINNAQFVPNRGTAATHYYYQGMSRVPFQVWEVDLNDSTTSPRQLNVAFMENNEAPPDGHLNGRWDPTADSTGGNEIVYIFNSTYQDLDPYWDNLYKGLITGSNNLFLTTKVDVMYVWDPKLLNDNNTVAQHSGEVLTIYPYYQTKPYWLYSTVDINKPFFYEFDVTAPVYGDPNYANQTNAMEKIKVVPNPYYGYSDLDRSTSDKFVTFRNLPLNCSIKIYTLNGDLVRTLIKSGTGSQASTMEWNLQNEDRVPIASGIYIALIDAPGIGQKVLKLVIFTSQERIRF